MSDQESQDDTVVVVTQGMKFPKSSLLSKCEIAFFISRESLLFRVMLDWVLLTTRLHLFLKIVLVLTSTLS